MARRNGPSSLATIYNDLRADFKAGKDSRFTSKLSGTSSGGSGMDYHYRSESQFLHMMERARFYQRNDPIVGQGVRRLVANIVQDGFKLDVNTGDTGLDSELKERFYNWSCNPDSCHSEGELTFSQMEQLVLSHVIVDGDLIPLPLKNGSLQMVEAHRCRSPFRTKRNIVHGVEMDDAGRRTTYWLTKEDLDPNNLANLKASDLEPYAARGRDGNRQVMHIYSPYRFSQRRGVTMLAPVSDTVGMHDDIQFATLVKAQMASLIALLHERGPNWEPGGDQQKGERYTETSGGYTKTIEGVSCGIEVFGDKDEKLSAFSPGIPSPEFFPHTMMILTFIGINLDMPVAVLLLDPSKTNFSGWRGAIDQARLRFKQIQRWLSDSFHSPVYRWKLRQWAASDSALRSRLAKDPDKTTSHRWNPPTFPYIEPLTDASADLLQQRNAMNSPRRIHAARGRDWDEVSTEIVNDNFMAIEKAIVASQKLNEKYKTQVHWRELVSLPTPDGVQIAFPQPQTDQQQEQNNDA